MPQAPTWGTLLRGAAALAPTSCDTTTPLARGAIGAGHQALRLSLTLAPVLAPCAPSALPPAFATTISLRPIQIRPARPSRQWGDWQAGQVGRGSPARLPRVLPLLPPQWPARPGSGRRPAAAARVRGDGCARATTSQPRKGRWSRTRTRRRMPHAMPCMAAHAMLALAPPPRQVGRGGGSPPQGVSMSCVYMVHVALT